MHHHKQLPLDASGAASQAQSQAAAGVGASPNRGQVRQEDQLMFCRISKARQQAFLGHGALQVLGALADRYQL